jgi:hypothetical protein
MKLFLLKQRTFGRGNPAKGETEVHTMKKKKTLVILSVVLALIIAAGIGAYAASNYGTSDDPLITLSYLDNKLTPDLMKQFDLKLDSTVAELLRFLCGYL